MHPLVVPVPGGPEILVLLGMALIYLAVPLLVVVAVYNVLDAKRGYERRFRRSSDASRNSRTSNP